METAAYMLSDGGGPITTASTAEPEVTPDSTSPTNTSSVKTFPQKSLVTIMFHRPLKTVPPEGVLDVARLFSKMGAEVATGAHLGTRQLTIQDQWPTIRRDGAEFIQQNQDIFTRATQIPGWYSREGLEQLASLAYGTLETAARFLEIGTWKGRSAYVLASVLSQVPGGKLHCVDTFCGLPQSPTDPRYNESVIEKTQQNLAGLPVELHQMESPGILTVFEPQSFALVHVDGDHSYPVCEQDIFNGWWLLQNGGVLCGDDYDEVKPSVERLGRAFNTKVFTFKEKLWWTIK